MESFCLNRCNLMLPILISMIVGITDVSCFSYLDSLSPQNARASNLPTTTTTTTTTAPKTSTYLDSLEGPPSEATPAATSTVAIAEEYDGINIGADVDTAVGTPTTMIATTMADFVASGRVGANDETKSEAAAAGATATSAYFLEQYNNQNPFVAKRKTRLSQEAAFFESPTQEDASKMDELTSLATEEASSIDDETDMTETQKLMKKVKEAGTAGVISYALWELGFWTFSVPVCVVGYYQYTGHWPDLSDPEDQKKLGAEAFAFVNVARFAVPLRIGLALGTTPWIDKNIVQRFASKSNNVEEQ